MKKPLFLLWLYRTVIILLLPIAIIRLFWKSQRNPDYRKRISERFAMALPQKQHNIWIHAVSVGEFNACLPLIKKLLIAKQTVLITTTTPTASSFVQQKLGDSVSHCYLPFDVKFLVRRFLSKTQPQVAIFVETEIWPNFILESSKQEIPVLLINARLSEKSYNRYAAVTGLSSYILSQFTTIACQNKSTVDRFNSLCGHAIYLGSMKFDISAPDNIEEKKRVIRQLLGDKPLILAASTHQGEETRLIQSFQDSAYQSSHVLVIAPRHPERSKDILAFCKKKQLVATTFQQATNNRLKELPSIMIIDTLGELLPFYAQSQFAIIGGSLVNHGGQNPLEPSLFGTPCIIGKNYFNFATIVDDMVLNNAIIIAHSDDELFPKEDQLLGVGENAKKFLLKNQGATDRYFQLILSHCPKL